MSSLPEKIKAALDKDPSMTVEQIAAAVQAEPAEVVAVLDTHRVGEDGTITEVEPGGGGWVTPESDSGDGA